MLHLSYILDGTGWATAKLGDGDHEVAMTASYLYDSLRQLAQAAIDIRDGAATASVVFMDEPGEHFLLLERGKADDLRLELRWFNDWASWNMYPPDKFETVFETRCAIRDFVTAVTAALDHLLEQWGIDGYQRKWVEHKFPVKQHAALAAR